MASPSAYAKARKESSDEVRMVLAFSSSMVLDCSARFHGLSSYQLLIPAGVAGVRVRMRVGVVVLVGVEVNVVVAEGREVQVGRGVRVKVLVDVGEGLETGVRVNNWVIFTRVGPAAGWDIKLISIPKNTRIPNAKKIKTGTKYGCREDELLTMRADYSTAVRNSDSIISI
jgi:Ethanolamine utilization protein EutJ (predicted chaperonin)